MARAETPDRSRLVAIWLFVTAAVVFGLVVVGGATRLTGSGLSITEWKPIMGVVPPLSDAGWASEFQKYRATTQYRYVNQGMSLAAFQSIYWWEWTHRLLGRLVGVVFAGPLLAFLALRRIPERLVVRCFILLGLGGLQGLVGWWMVESGLEGRVAVAPERLAAHLGLALLLYAALIWTGLEAIYGPARPTRHGRASFWRWATPLLAVLVYVQCLLGALVAGDQAGLVDNDWPLMNGRIFPVDYWIGGTWQSLLHSQAAVQFNHRLMGYTVAVIALALAVAAGRAREASNGLRLLAFGVAALVVAQASLGVMTLMARAPLPLSQLHQALAAVVLSAAVALAWRGRRA
ncbi:MAG TPA: COX15/CtaA family protein [Caulobacteraceae bacterium]|nr:COX15/CtaA family protein [Caulobacteraceae bacterium]